MHFSNTASNQCILTYFIISLFITSYNFTILLLRRFLILIDTTARMEHDQGAFTQQIRSNTEQQPSSTWYNDSTTWQDPIPSTTSWSQVIRSNIRSSSRNGSSSSSSGWTSSSSGGGGSSGSW